MSQPFPHPYAQQSAPAVSQATHPVDLVLSSFGWVLLAGGCAFLGVVSPFAVLAGLACGPGDADPAICTSSGSTAYVAALIGCLLAFVVACTVSLVGVIVAFARGARAWPWVLAGHGIAALATVVFVVVGVAVTA